MLLNKSAGDNTPLTDLLSFGPFPKGTDVRFIKLYPSLVGGLANATFKIAAAFSESCPASIAEFAVLRDQIIGLSMNGSFGATSNVPSMMLRYDGGFAEVTIPVHRVVDSRGWLCVALIGNADFGQFAAGVDAVSPDGHGWRE